MRLFSNHIAKKMLDYRRETALQGALVLAKSRRLECYGTLFYGHYRSTSPQLHNRFAKISKSVKERKIRVITPFKVIQVY